MASVFLNLGTSFERDGAFPVMVREEQVIPRTHEYLFRFLEADFSRLEAYARSYLACVGMQAPGDPLALQRVFEELFALHPYYRACPAAAAALANAVFAGYVKGAYPDDAEQSARALDCACTAEYTGEKNTDYWMEHPAPVAEGKLFCPLYDLQRDVSLWVFLALDNASPELAKLTAVQRNAVYGLIYGGEFSPVLETRAQMSVQRPKAFGTLSAALAFDGEFISEVYQGIDDMREDPAAPAPENVQKILSAAERVAEDCEYRTYEIESLADLLKFEVYGMTQAGVRVKKCKYCKRYFVLEKGNLEYCDRISAGETKPCSEIGKSRTYEQRVSGGNSAMALYRRAYKTHFARVSNGIMGKDAFEQWKADAMEKRRLAEAGEMEFDAYAAWLKK